MKIAFSQQPLQVIKAAHKDIHVFSTNVENIDAEVVQSFGDEWEKFDHFDHHTINKIAEEYFDIIDDTILNKNSYAIDIGCGTGRWSKYISSRAGFIECVDPSKAIFSADRLLADIDNVRLSQASTESLPFPDETFDFAMSIGVLHHIPDTQKAMNDCVKKVKKGGYFYCYLYYDLDNRGAGYKALFKASDLIRRVVCRLPQPLKKASCDALAVTLYMPWVLLSRFFVGIGMREFAKKIPLAAYENKSFFVIRNDSLDRFGTKIEHRYSRKEVIDLMQKAGLSNIKVSNNTPFYHAVGRK